MLRFYTFKKRQGKLGFSRAYKARLLGYSYTTIMTPTYQVIAVAPNGSYGKIRMSKDVIFDPMIDFTTSDETEYPTDQEFLRLCPDIPLVTPLSDQPPELDTPVEHPHPNPDPEPDPTTPSDDYPIEGWVEYWLKLKCPDLMDEYAKVELTHYLLKLQAKNPLVPKTYAKAMASPLWAAAIEKEKEKFRKNNCLLTVPFTGQHLVPMMWLFVIKTDGTYKARLVGRGDLMLAWIDFDPDAVYCGNVSSCAIKMCITISAKNKLVMRGGDLEGAYLVTRANADFPVFIKTP
jgi:hypothetical protein